MRTRLHQNVAVYRVYKMRIIQVFAKWSYIVMPGKRNDVKESKRRGVRSSAQDFVVFFDFLYK